MKLIVMNLANCLVMGYWNYEMRILWGCECGLCSLAP